MELSATHVGSPNRREMPLFLGALAHYLLTLLGEAGESCDLDSAFTRPLSLYRQGRYWYDALPALADERLTRLMQRLGSG